MNCNLKLLKARIEGNPENSRRKKKEKKLIYREKNLEGGELSYVILVESEGGEFSRCLQLNHHNKMGRN